ncbi:LLM class flavin-dependent oxidoreductase [Actinoallomurus sp. NBC_01490]|jgi:alkanesulfonate monooxygenase SsuD/methylene tetrahydromethanopterin reductase-like flavin-dependent oxidoreductase (luciferase family)|uniref:LLM class flavin-dependent oxidoreductase n=1 Tax=Actinoallomurus sp. NBC_01490 TaxID=2903557 RepID=UPI002E32B0C5|nr:LLM class flavin-dependent oxidoreductase [Actinoallomurus sp. NBC_01490]
MTAGSELHLAIALEPGGWHPAAWHDSGPHSDGLFGAAYWADLVREAEKGLVDFVTIEDVLAPHPSGGTDAPGRLDAALVATSAAARTDHIGIVPTVTVTHAEPFHTATTIATLDRLSGGRAGFRVRVSGLRRDAQRIGRTAGSDVPDLADPEFVAAMADRFDQAAEHVEVVREFWNGRVDFAGRWYTARGRAATARPPQVAPPVTALAHVTIPYRLAARAADLVYVTPRDVDDARAIIGELQTLRAEAGGERSPLLVFGELVVFLDSAPGAAAERAARLDARAAFSSDALVFAGTPAELADLMETWQAAGISGFRLRPGAVPADLAAVTRLLVPELQARGLFRKEYETRTLREHLGLRRL